MPDRDVLQMPEPKLRWCICVRSPGERWVESDYTESLDDAIDAAEMALAAGQCVMIEPCPPVKTAG